MYAVELNGLAIGRQISFIHKYRYMNEDREKVISGWLCGLYHNDTQTQLYIKPKKASANHNFERKAVAFDTEIGFLDGN